MPKFSCAGFDGHKITDEAALKAHIAQQAATLPSGAFLTFLENLLQNPTIAALIQALLAKILTPPATT